ncbi:MAG: hypothetical protein AAF694_00690 [Bacteroidota bacterium]
MINNQGEKYPIQKDVLHYRPFLQKKTLKAIEKTLHAFYDSDEEELTDSQLQALKLLQEVYGKLIHS